MTQEELEKKIEKLEERVKVLEEFISHLGFRTDDYETVHYKDMVAHPVYYTEDTTII